MVQIPDIFFGAADSQMEAFLDRDAFERGFLFGLLFQGNLVITDTFFYMSSHLRAMLSHDHNGWLAAALSDGAVVPSFRSDCKGSFAQNFAEVQSQGIKGPTEAAGRFVSELDHRLDSSIRYRYRVWPNKLVGGEYLKVCENVFLSKDDSKESTRGMFEQVQVLAEHIIPAAASRGGGLRRAEIYSLVARHFGVAEELSNSAATIVSSIEDRSNRNIASYFLKWANYCYQYNQGAISDLSPALNSMDGNDETFTERLFPKAGGHRDDTAEAIRKVVQIPSLNQLRSVPIVELLGVRHGEKGGGYFSRLHRWQNDPNEENANSLVKAIEEYVNELNAVYLRHGRNVVNPARWIEALIPIRNVTMRQLMRNTAAWLAESVVSPLGVINLLRENVACSYTYLPEIVKDAVDAGLGISQKVALTFHDEERRINYGKHVAGVRTSITDRCFGI